MKKYKIILIILDALRTDAFGWAKNLQRLAEQSVYFNNAYTTITKTDPAISAIMAGKYPCQIGLINHGKNVTRREEEAVWNNPYLSELLLEKNFETMAIDWMGRWHQKGFAAYSGSLSETKDLAEAFILGSKAGHQFFRWLRRLDLLSLKLAKREFFQSFVYHEILRMKLPYDPADLVVNRAKKFLEKTRDKPIFAYLHLWDTHLPYQRHIDRKRYFFSTLRQKYQQEVVFLDSQLGKLIDFLQADQDFKNTLLIITADHGESLGEHKIFMAHRGLYEEVVKVPLLICHRSFKARKTNALVQHIDIAPTILDFLEIKGHWQRQVDGKSLLPLLKGRKRRVRDFVFFEDIFPEELKAVRATRKRGLRWGDFKYIETLTGKKAALFRPFPSKDVSLVKEELYDLGEDSEEKENLAEQRPLLVKKSRDKLEGLITFLKLKNRQERKRGSSTAARRFAKSATRKDKEKMIRKLRHLGYW